jgi:hypothetical protein
MTLMKLRKRLASRKTTQFILWALVFVFVASIAMTGMYGGRGNSNPNSAPRSSGLFGGKVIATVNGQAIKSDVIEKFYAEQLASLKGSAPTIDQAPGMRQTAFAQAIQAVLKKQALAKYHVGVNYFSLRDYANEYARMQVADVRASVEKDRKAKEKAAKTSEEKAKIKSFDAMLSEAYESSLSRMSADGKTTVSKPIDDKKFTNAYVNDFLLSRSETGIYERFADYVKTQRIGEASTKDLPVDPFTAEYAKKLFTQEAKASMIFIAAKDTSPEGIKAAKDEALKLYKELEKNPASFTERAKKETDDPMTGMKDGSLGWLQVEQNASIVEYLAFTTKPGEISPVSPMMLQSYFGNKLGYVIVKTEKVQDRKTPDERWAQGAEVSVLRIRQRYGPEMGSGYLDFAQAEANIQCKTEEMATYLAVMRGDVKGAAAHREKAQVDKAVPEEVRAGFAFTLGTDTPDLKKRIAYLLQAMPFAGSNDRSAKIAYDLGVAYADTAQKDKAIEQFVNASVMAGVKDRSMREQLKAQFLKLGDKTNAALMDKWLKDNPETAPTGMEGMGGMGGFGGMGMPPQ